MHRPWTRRDASDEYGTTVRGTGAHGAPRVPASGRLGAEQPRPPSTALYSPLQPSTVLYRPLQARWLSDSGHATGHHQPSASGASGSGKSGAARRASRGPRVLIGTLYLALQHGLGARRHLQQRPGCLFESALPGPAAACRPPSGSEKSAVQLDSAARVSDM
ncbi:hypothetical protein CDD83_6751 [Cordyceps sp. RAO-2017]|nr:hypothetical protein CDD83_6751 [Cordyceps sp. RAO-2017]